MTASPSRSFRAFVTGLLILTPCLAFNLVLFNFLMDPFNLYLSFKIEGVNAVKSEIESQSRLARALDIARQQPKALLLGTSRVMGGFDPRDLTRLTGEYAYNAGIGGANFEEIHRLFEHALHHQPNLKVVVVGLDLFAFSRHKKQESELAPERLRMFPALPWKDVYASLFTPLACLGSYRTLKKNLTGTASPVFFSNGQYNPYLFSSERNLLLTKGDLDFVKRMFSSSILYRSYQLDPDKIRLFQRMAKTCQEKSIRLECFICPCKAIYWQALYQKGYWPLLQELKSNLVKACPIWDFSGYNSVTTQAIERPSCPLYFECSHFTPELGKMMLEKMFNAASKPEEFGCLLTEKNMEEHRLKMEDNQLKWANEHADLIEKIERALQFIQP